MVIKIIIVVGLIITFGGLIYEIIKTRMSRDSYITLFDVVCKEYTALFDAIYTAHGKENTDGSYSIIYTVKDNLKELLPDIKQEINVANLKY